MIENVLTSSDLFCALRKDIKLGNNSHWHCLCGQSDSRWFL